MKAFRSFLLLATFAAAGLGLALWVIVVTDCSSANNSTAFPPLSEISNSKCTGPNLPAIAESDQTDAMLESPLPIAQVGQRDLYKQLSASVTEPIMPAVLLAPQIGYDTAAGAEDKLAP
jgi:hypothetical protein